MVAVICHWAMGDHTTTVTLKSGTVSSGHPGTCTGSSVLHQKWLKQIS